VKIVTLSFDDGFADSFPRIADIYERNGLKASLNVIATGHLKSFVPPDPYHQGYPSKAGFETWNALAARGHEIMPHGLKHADKGSLPFKTAQSMITKCLAIFRKNLRGYSDKKAIFNFPYNRSTPELESWLAGKLLAFRTGGPALNPLPHARTFRLTNTADGPGNCERRLDALL
jgi:peptidoglycan/xylan/chitin deacetylase (PgdA/CDA1 family)